MYSLEIKKKLMEVFPVFLFSTVFLHFLTLCKKLKSEFVLYSYCLRKVEHIQKDCFDLQEKITDLESSLFDLKTKYFFIAKLNEDYISSCKLEVLSNPIESILALLAVTITICFLLYTLWTFYNGLVVFNFKLSCLNDLLIELKSQIEEADLLFDQILPFLERLPADLQMKLLYYKNITENLSIVLENLVVDRKYSFLSSPCSEEMFNLLFSLKNYLISVIVPTLQTIINTINSIITQ